MKRLIIAALTATLLSAAPAAAQAPGRPATASERAELRSAEAYIQALMAWNGAYVQILTDHAGQLDRLNADLAKAIAFRDEKRTREGAAWAETWSVERRADMEALDARLKALPRKPPPLAPDMAREPRLVKALQGLSQTPDLTARQLDVDHAMMHQMIDAAVAVASGRDSTGVRLVTAFYDLNIAMLDSQSVQQRAFLDMGLTDGHPQQKVLEITIQYDNAGVAALKLLRADLRGERFDRAAGSATVRAEARAMIQSAREMSRLKDAYLQQMKSAPDAPYTRKLIQALMIYGETANSAMTVAARLDQLANTIDRGAEMDADAVGSAVDAAAGPLAEIMAQDARRRAILGGG